MANIIKKNPNSNGNKPIRVSVGTCLIILIISIAAGLYYAAEKSVIALIISVGMIALLAVLFIFSIFGNDDGDSTFVIPGEQHERIGMLGELKTGIMLEERLSEEYTVIQNARITFKGKSSEIDNIVVSKTGVYIIEVKTMKGTICGDYSDHDWKQLKVDQYGISHEKTFYSPVKQVGTHVYRLANYLRDNKIFTHVNALVYFSSPETKLDLTGIVTDIPVYSYATTDDMIMHIKHGNEHLSKSTLNAIINLLN